MEMAFSLLVRSLVKLRQQRKKQICLIPNFLTVFKLCSDRAPILKFSESFHGAITDYTVALRSDSR